MSVVKSWRKSTIRIYSTHTLFNAVFIGMFLVSGLALIGSCDTLHTLVEVVLSGRASLGFFAFCIASC